MVKGELNSHFRKDLNMTNTFELEKAIRVKGLTKKAVALSLGLTEQGFLLKLNNKNEFKASEIQFLCEMLDCSKDIFFASNVN